MATQIAPKAVPSERIDSAKRFVLSSFIVLSRMVYGFIVAATESKVVLSKLFQIPFTCIGMLCINIGFFHIIHEWGWITSGITLIILEAMIADTDDA